MILPCSGMTQPPHPSEMAPHPCVVSSGPACVVFHLCGFLFSYPSSHIMVKTPHGILDRSWSRCFMPNQSLGIRRLLQIKLLFCLFNHFNSLQCEIWTCQQMASVLCLAAGGESATAVPEPGKLETRMTCSLVLLFSQARTRPFSGTHNAGQKQDCWLRPGVKDMLSTSMRCTTWPDLLDDPRRLVFKTRNHRGTNRLKKRCLKMVTAFL